MSIFAERLRAKREEKGLTQVQLAEAVGVDSRTVSLWERSKQMPAEETCESIAKALDTSMWYLLGNKEDTEGMFLTDAEAAAVADAEEQETYERMLKLYNELSPHYQKVARAMIGTLWKMQKDETGAE